jgi:hypothetical protein
MTLCTTRAKRPTSRYEIGQGDELPSRLFEIDGAA